MLSATDAIGTDTGGRQRGVLGSSSVNSCSDSRRQAAWKGGPEGRKALYEGNKDA